MLQANLRSIQDYFDQKNIKCILKKDYLALHLGANPICLYVVKLEEPKGTFIQFRYFFPNRFIPEKAGELALFLLRVNQGLQFPGFGLIETDQIVYFRYDLFCTLDKMNEKILEGVLGNILMYMDNYKAEIEALSTPPPPSV